MSNEQVILEMVINRLGLLLEAHEELKAKWSAEITEIILLGKGVLVATPEHHTPDGKWLLILSGDELNMLSEVVNGASVIEDYRQDTVNPLASRLYSLNEENMAIDLEPQDDDEHEGDDDPAEDEPIAAPGAPEPLYAPHVIWRNFAAGEPEPPLYGLNLDDLTAQFGARLVQAQENTPEIPNEQD